MPTSSVGRQALPLPRDVHIERHAPNGDRWQVMQWKIDSGIASFKVPRSRQARRNVRHYFVDFVAGGRIYRVGPDDYAEEMFRENAYACTAVQ